MSKGRFSAPRSHEDEDDLTTFPRRSSPANHSVWEETENTLSEELLQTDTAPEEETTVLPQMPDTDFFFPELETETPKKQEPENEPTFLDKVMDFWHKTLKFCKENQKMVLLGACSLTLVFIIAIIALIFVGTSDPYGKKILNNVYCGDVYVGGMTKKEAIQAVNDSTLERYARENMVIDLDGNTLRLSPADVNAKLDVKGAVQEAYAYGRTGSQAQREQERQQSLTEPHYVALLPYLELNEDYIREVLDNYVHDTGATLTQTAYGLEGDEPELSAKKFDENAPCQTLVITMGKPGIDFDSEQVYQQILDAYSLSQFQVTVEDVEHISEPDALDLQKVYDEFYIAPEDATVDPKNFTVIPGSYGYGFDLEKAQEMVDGADYGEELRISMEYIKPEILDANDFYQDTLSQTQTPHTDNEKRNTNLRLACEALDGLVMNPGEVFSFNTVLGKRTADKGYQPAPAYVGDELVDSLGGGICQVSSTLYYAALLADMEIVSRTNHGFPVSYMEKGLDATVSWGGPDFQFKNSSAYPVKLSARVEGGYVKIAILGNDSRTYDVKIESRLVNTITPEIEYVDMPYDNEEGYADGDVIENGSNGYVVKTYKLKYDRETGALLAEELIATSQYKTVTRKVARVEPAPTDTTEPPTESTEPPTESTEPPTESTAPSTDPSTDPTSPTDTGPTTGPTNPSGETGSGEES